MRALVDGDIVAHRCGYASDNDSEVIALVRTNAMMEEILAETSSEEYTVFLSDSYDNNFRKHLAPSYKANRVQARPVHLEAIKEFLFREWQANLSLGMEADDSLGIHQDDGRPTYDIPPECFQTVICSIDKDLLQIPGNHWNFVRKEWKLVQPQDGLKWFYAQLLIGDTSDNIRGVDKIGPVKAAKLLDPLNTEIEWFDAVRQLYNDDERLLLNGRLLWIRRQDEELWNFPKNI